MVIGSFRLKAEATDWPPVASGFSRKLTVAMTSQFAPLVAMLNQAFVDRYLEGADPVGQRLAT